MQNRAIDKVLDIVRTHLYEQPVNNVGDGKIAGTVEAGDDPPVRRKKKPPVLGRGIMLGLRKRWSTGKV